MRVFGKSFFVACLSLGSAIESQADICQLVFDPQASLGIEQITQLPLVLTVPNSNLNTATESIQRLNTRSGAIDGHIKSLLDLDAAPSTTNPIAPRALNAREAEALHATRRKIPTSTILKVRAEETKAPGDLSLLAIEDSLVSMADSSYLFTDADLLNIQELNKRAKKLAVNARSIQRDLSPEMIAKVNSYNDLRSSQNDIEEAIRQLEPDQSLLLVLPSYSQKSQSLVLKPEQIKSVTRFRDRLAILEIEQRKLNAINERVLAYNDEYLRLMQLRGQALGIDQSEILYSHKVNPSSNELLEIERKRDVVASEIKDIAETLASSQPVHPSIKQIELSGSRASYGAQGRKAWKKAVGIIVGIGVAGTFINNPQMVYGWYENTKDWIFDNAKFNDDKYWIEKCSAKEGLDALKNCLRVFRSKMSVSLRKKIAIEKKKNPSYNDRPEKALFQKRFDNVLKSVLNNSSADIFFDTYSEMAMDFGFQEIFNFGKTLSKNDEEEAKNKNTPQAKKAPHPIEIFQERIFKETADLDKVLKEKEDDVIEKSIAMIKFLAKMDAIQKLLLESQDLKSDPKLKATLELISDKIEAVDAKAAPAAAPVPATPSPAAPAPSP